MGKNPNAKKEKVRQKGKERQFQHDVESLEEEAARRGCEIWELDEVRKEQEKIDEESSEEDEKKEDDDQSE